MDKNGKMPVIRLVVLFAGLAGMICGFLTGEAGVVLRKAAAICLECVGIG